MEICRDKKALLDYIINLQQENDDLKNRLENAVADCNLRLQENERLKEANKILEKNWEHYMVKCGKAIEYINHYQNYGKEKYVYVSGDDLLNILQNGSVK